MSEIKTMANLGFSFLKGLEDNTTEDLAFTESEQVCPKHGPYIARTYSDGFVSDCPKCTDERIAERKRLALEAEQKKIEEREAAIKRERHIEYCKGLNISPEFYFATLDDYIPKTKGQELAKIATAALIKNKRGKVILLGSNGVGKTMLASIASMALGGPIYTMYEMATMIRQSYTSKAEKSELEIVKDFINFDFLVIDEAGRVAASEAVLNWFSFILDQRHSLGKPTWINGNLHFRKDCEEKGCPKCFENYFDKDMLSRFHEDTTVINIKANDEREGKKTLKYFSD